MPMFTCKTANNISKCKINVSDNKPKNSDKVLKHLLTPLEAYNFENVFSKISNFTKVKYFSFEKIFFHFSKENFIFLYKIQN